MRLVPAVRPRQLPQSHRVISPCDHTSPPPPATLCVQIRDPEKEKAACASPRACVASFPTTVVEGMLFAWLESGPEAEQEAAAQQPYIMPEQVRSLPCVSSRAVSSVLCWLVVSGQSCGEGCTPWAPTVAESMYTGCGDNSMLQLSAC